MGLFENLPYTNFHRVNMDWILTEIKRLSTEWAAMQESFTTYENAFNSLKEYVDNYFEELDLQEEVDAKLDTMAADGSLDELFSKFLIPRTPVFERTVNSMYKCAMSYLGQNMVYGNETTAFDASCLDKQIDCSTFCLLVLGGIDYNNSRYVRDNNYYKSAGYGYNHFPSRTWEQIGVDRYSWNLAKSFKEKGWAFEPASDYSNIEAGDILFFAFPEEGGDVEKWEGINHCAVALGRSMQDNPIPIVIADANLVEGTRTNAIQCSTIYGGYLSSLKYIVRVPLEECGKIDSLDYSINAASMNAVNISVASGEMFTAKVKGHGRLRIFLNSSARVLDQSFNGEYTFRGAYPGTTITNILFDCSAEAGGILESFSLINGYTNHIEESPYNFGTVTLANLYTAIASDLTAVLPNFTKRLYRARITDNPYAGTWADIEAIRTQQGIAVFLKGASGGTVINETHFISV